MILNLSKFSHAALQSLARLALPAWAMAVALGCSPSSANFNAGSISTNTLETGIIGGQLIPQTSSVVQSTAFVFLYNKATHDGEVCSGVLVANDLVLTAAHCFHPQGQTPRGRTYSKFVIFGTHVDLGAPDALKQAYVIGEDSYAIDPTFEPATFANDMAVLRLKGRLLPGLIPAKILKEISILSNAKQPVIVAGFGLSSAQTTDAALAYRLRYLTTMPALIKDPRAAGTLSIVTSATHTPALGDSGGPAFTSDNGVRYVWGIDSFNLSSSTNSSYGEFYTVIARHLSWLNRAAAQLGSPATF